MNNFAQRFTSWYCRKGYRMRFDVTQLKLIFDAPWWVRLVASMFFSPCTYYREVGYEHN